MVKINYHLRGVSDACNCAVGVVPPLEGEIGDGVQFMEKGTGYLKEVGKELVSSPLSHQMGETVKYIEDP
jgi:hypothetical protein